MLVTIKNENILFLDIETVPQVYGFENLNEKIKTLFEDKNKHLLRDDTTIEEIYKKAAIYAEFGKIICISCGFITQQNGNRELRIKSFYGDDEKKLLADFAELLNKSYNTENHKLCAHNGKEFDFPYLCRRMVINEVKLPAILQLQGKKPWEVQHIDTMELWKFGDYKNFTSLELLTELFGIPSPKDGIKGSDVGRVYWEEKNLKKIVEYCQKDVIALCRVYLRFCYEPFLPDENIKIINE